MASVTLKMVGTIEHPMTNASLVISDNEWVVLAGPDGCGTSAVLRTIAGLTPAKNGQEIWIDDQPIHDQMAKDRGVAMVFRTFALYPHLTVAENIALPLRLRALADALIQSKVADAAKALSIEALLAQKPKALSASQQLQVALARAMAQDPRLIVMDNPLSTLDPQARAAMRAELRAWGKTLTVPCLYATDDWDDALALGDRIAVMKDDVLVQVDLPRVLIDHPAHQFVTECLGESRINRFTAKLAKREGGVYVEVGTQYVRIPPSKLQRFTSDSAIGREAWIAFPVEALSVVSDLPSARPDTVVEARVTALDASPEGTLITLAVDGMATPLIAHETKPFEGQVGDEVRLVVDTDALLFFDRESGDTLLSR